MIDSTGLVLGSCAAITRGVTTDVAELPAETVNIDGKDLNCRVRSVQADGDFPEYGRGVSSWRSKATLLAGLKKTHSDGERKIQTAGELHMLQHIRRFDGERGTRLAWMIHGISHEEYHRGQLALYARLLGRVPALTKKIQGG